MIRAMHTGLLLAAAMVLSTQAWGQQPGGQATPQPGPEQQQHQQPGATTPEGGMHEMTACSPEQVAAILQAMNDSAIGTAKLALRKSQDDDVRAYAQKTIDAHTKLQKRLNEALERAGMTPADNDLATQLKKAGAHALDYLGSSQQFDHDYVTHEVFGHAKAYGLLKSIAPKPGEEESSEEEEGQAQEQGQEQAQGEAQEHASGEHALASVIEKACKMFQKHTRKALELESKIVGQCGSTEYGGESRPITP